MNRMPADAPTVLRVRIEVPRGAFIKPAADGQGIDLISPVPAPFNYGSVPGTTGPDGDPWDAVVLGPRLRRGIEVERQVVGYIDFVDGGAPDPKWICSSHRVRWHEKVLVTAFFEMYAKLKSARDLLTRRHPQSTVRGVFWADRVQTLP